jgi:phenylacetic acid degradation operon negative regulatory protein
MRDFIVPSIQTQHLIFNLFGDYVNPRGGAAWTSGLIEVLDVLNVTERATRSTLSRMKSKGWLWAGREGRRSFYALTQKGKAVLEEGSQRLFGPRASQWDGRWHVVAYALPQTLRKRRHQLRTRLSWLGYGMLEPGLMVAAYPRKEEVITLVDDLEIQPHVHFFTNSKSELTESESIVAKCWDLDELNTRYAGFIQRWQKSYDSLRHKLAQDGHLPCDESFVHRFWATYEYSGFPRQDPYLPPELLPDDWLGLEAADLLRRYRELLQKPAEEFIKETLPIIRITRERAQKGNEASMAVEGSR